MEDALELQKLAEWYRAFAQVGRSEHRDDRLKLAEYLERRAAELDKAEDGMAIHIVAIGQSVFEKQGFKTLDVAVGSLRGYQTGI